MPTRTPDSHPTIQLNTAALQKDMDWFDKVLSARLANHFKPQPRQIEEIAPPKVEGSASGTYAALLHRFAMNTEERLVLLLALIPHLRPQALDPLFARNRELDHGFSEFGGCSHPRHNGFLPTWETAAFLIAGTDLEQRLGLIRLFQRDHFFFREGILRTDADNGEAMPFSKALRISNEYLYLLTTGEHWKPDFGADFPARRLTTSLAWNELILPPAVREELGAFQAWTRLDPETMAAWGLHRLAQPGYRALFYGPPGTGKTLAATLLGQRLGLDVYCIDLAVAISGDMGEIAGNLAHMFEQAAARGWLLVFDKADILFGTGAEACCPSPSASWLRQYLDGFPGVAILISRQRANVGEVFSHRFHASIHFPMPEAEERLLLWQGVLGDKCPWGPDVDLDTLARKYELSGGAIVSAVRHAALRARQRGRDQIMAEDLKAGMAQVWPDGGEIAS